MLIKLTHIKLLVLFIGFTLMANSQEKSIQASMKVEKSYNKTSASKLSLMGEKADINIQPSKDENYHITIEFISQHSDALLAQEQLKYMKYLISNKGKTIFLRNYLLIEQGKSIAGTIKAKYTLQIPSNVKLEIKNSLGNINVSNTQGELSIESKYGQINLQNTVGKIKLNCSIGDVFINKCSTIANIELHYMNAYFNDNSGEYNLTSNMGTCTFSLNQKIDLLNIEANGTNIVLNNKQDLYFGYFLETELGKISIDESCIPVKSNIRIDDRLKNKKDTRFEYRKPSLPTNIIISNKYNNISLQ